MAAAPQLAPAKANHLLRTSSVITAISYGPDSITYTKFDSASTETIKFGAWTPLEIRGGTMVWNNAEKVLSVTATLPAVTIYAHAVTRVTVVRRDIVFKGDMNSIRLYDLKGKCVHLNNGASKNTGMVFVKKDRGGHASLTTRADYPLKIPDKQR
jgi:hypothetical protein